MKTRLQKQIGEIDDITRLKAVEAFLASITDDVPFQLNEEQKESIRISKEQFEKGQHKSHKEVISNARRWLKRK